MHTTLKDCFRAAYQFSFYVCGSSEFRKDLQLIEKSLKWTFLQLRKKYQKLYGIVHKWRHNILIPSLQRPCRNLCANIHVCISKYVKL